MRLAAFSSMKHHPKGQSVTNKNTYLLHTQFGSQGVFKVSPALSLSVLHVFIGKLMTSAVIRHFCCATVAIKNKGFPETP